LLAVAASATPTFAQAIHEGKLTGTVASVMAQCCRRHRRGLQPVAHATRSATTSGTGTYVILNLPIGRYTVTCRSLDSRTAVRENIEVSAMPR
jgi:hypothetical protein